MTLSRVKKLFSLLAVALLGGSVIVIVATLNAQTSTAPQNANATDTYVSAYNPKVLAIVFNPSTGTRNVADTYFKNQMGGKTALQQEDALFNSTIQDFKDLSHSRVNFQIVKKLVVSDFPFYPDGSYFTVDSFRTCVPGQPGYNASACDQKKSAFDYVQWLSDHQVCDLAAQNNVDEIWVLSAPNLMPWDNFMIGPDKGFDVNGQSYIVPQCHKHYIVLNGTYNRSDSLLHSFGYRAEATLNYVTKAWNAQDQQQYWERFANVSRYTSPALAYNGVGCGNTRFPANAASAFDTADTTSHLFNCEDWRNFPNLTGIYSNYNCNKWGCSDEGWQKFWLGSLPSNPGNATMQTTAGQSFTFKKDWWWYILSADNAITFVTGVR